MQTFIYRNLQTEIVRALNNYPVVAILGPRQCGKSTLANHILKRFADTILLDLESPSDLRKLAEPEFFLSSYEDTLVCIDEIQREPELFPILRVLVDKNRKNGRFLILGSASQDLIRQSTESLAGRIAFLELTPFQLSEVDYFDNMSKQLWLRGGYPESLLKNNEQDSYEWRENFIRTFLERDIPQLGFNLPSPTMRRLWTMLAHSHGQTLNGSKLGAALGVSHTTIAKYIDILEATYMIRVLRPLVTNIKKRLIKSPKIYLRDSGILHALLEIETLNNLFGHPVFGSSWEGYALENIISASPKWRHSFYRTSSGEEIDLILQRKNRIIAVEFKASTAPKLSKGIYRTLDVLEVDHCLIVTPIENPYQLSEKIKITSIQDAINIILSDD
jgi:uncharacterized protein